MKLTKETLKQIIREELEAAMDEGFMDMFRKKKAMPAEEPMKKMQLPAYEGAGDIRELAKYISMHYDRQEVNQAMDIFKRLGEMPAEKVMDLGKRIQDDKNYLGRWMSNTEEMLEREGV